MNETSFKPQILTATILGYITQHKSNWKTTEQTLFLWNAWRIFTQNTWHWLL